MKRRPFRVYFVLALILLVALVIATMCMGRYGQTPLETVKILLSKIFPIEPTWTNGAYITVMKVRFPRVIGAVIVGASLSLAGTTYQGIFKNPLVSPDLLGVSSGASVGAAITILLGTSAAFIQFGALIGGASGCCYDSDYSKAA